MPWNRRGEARDCEYSIKKIEMKKKEQSATEFILNFGFFLSRIRVEIYHLSRRILYTHWETNSAHCSSTADSTHE